MTAERTYRREDLIAARRAWEGGEFGVEWQPYRELAAQYGLIFPPDGTRWDGWEDRQPSQRAIVFRAISDTPRLLRRLIIESTSWGQVVGRLMAAVDALRDEADLAELHADLERRGQPSRTEAMHRLDELLAR